MKSGCYQAIVVVFGQSACIGKKMFVFGISGYTRA